MYQAMLSVSGIALPVLFLHRNFEQFCDTHLAPYGLSHGLYMSLVYINRYPGCRPSELAEQLNVNRGHVTRVVDKLQQLGYVKKAANDTDVRARTLHLTQEGAAIIGKIREMFLLWEAQFEEDISTEEQKVLAALLKKLMLHFLPEKEENGISLS